MLETIKFLLTITLEGKQFLAAAEQASWMLWFTHGINTKFGRSLLRMAITPLLRPLITFALSVAAKKMCC